MPALPEFEAPPLVEVSLGVQFEPLEALRTPQIGLLWNEFRGDFPEVEEHPPLAPTIEKFGRPRIRPNLSLEFVDSVTPPRIFFLTSDGQRLLQIQQDRFILNWRKVTNDQPYPRYDGELRNAYRERLGAFTAFLAKEGLGELAANQCELTYVNLVGSEGSPPEPFKVLSLLSEPAPDSLVASVESVRLALAIRIVAEDGRPLGRLHVASEPTIVRATGEDAMLLRLTARGAPLGPGVEGVLAFLDLGREWIVRSFADLTTREMHEQWRRLV